MTARALSSEEPPSIKPQGWGWVLHSLQALPPVSSALGKCPAPTPPRCGEMGLPNLSLCVFTLDATNTRTRKPLFRDFRCYLFCLYYLKKNVCLVIYLGRQRGFQAGSMPLVQSLMWGSNSRTVRSCPEPESKVRRLTD